jgi:hypothetical protein
MVMQKRLLGADAIHSETFEKYITWHNSVRIRSDQDIEAISLEERILRLNFESFFVDYDNTIKEIQNFIGFDYSHKDKKLRFNPNSMNNHVGIWKNHHDQYTISMIKERLHDNYFWNH